MADDDKSTVNLSVTHAELERHAWTKFRPKVLAARTMADAVALAMDAPAVGAPSYPLYANLATFLTTLAPPAEAGPAERVLYAELVGRLVESDSLSEEAAAPCLARLKAARDETPSV